MGKLAERLGDPARAGIYRVEVTEALEEAAELNGYLLLRMRLDADAASQLLARIAGTPQPDGRVFVLSGFERWVRSNPSERDSVFEALGSAAEGWRASGARVFVVFLDPARALPALPPLYNWQKKSQARETTR